MDEIGINDYIPRERLFPVKTAGILAYPGLEDIDPLHNTRFLNTKAFPVMPIAGWPKNDELIVQSLARSTNQNSTTTPVKAIGVNVPPLWGRGGIIDSFEVQTVDGILIWDVVLKGFPVKRIRTDQELAHNEGEWAGKLSAGDVLLDWIISHRLHRKGLRTSLGLAAFDVEANTQKDYWPDTPSLSARMMRDGRRVPDILDLSQEDVAKLIVKIRSEQEKKGTGDSSIEVRDIKDYLQWFAFTLGQQVGIMQTERYLHSNLRQEESRVGNRSALGGVLRISNNITLAAEIVDHGTGEFFKEPEQGTFEEDWDRLADQYLGLLMHTRYVCAAFAQKGFIPQSEEAVIAEQMLRLYHQGLWREAQRDDSSQALVHVSHLESNKLSELLKKVPVANQGEFTTTSLFWKNTLGDLGLDKWPTKDTVDSAAKLGSQSDLDQQINHAKLHHALAQKTYSYLDERGETARLSRLIDRFNIRGQGLVQRDFAIRIQDIVKRFGLDQFQTQAFYRILLNLGEDLEEKVKAKSGVYFIKIRTDPSSNFTMAESVQIYSAVTQGVATILKSLFTNNEIENIAAKLPAEEKALLPEISMQEIQ